MLVTVTPRTSRYPPGKAGERVEVRPEDLVEAVKYSRKRETPMAVMSAAIFGRRAADGTPGARWPPQGARTPRRRRRRRPAGAARSARWSRTQERPDHEDVAVAKLMRRTIPYTIVYPRAIRAYTNPSCRPSGLAGGNTLWVHHLHERLLPALDLQDRGALDAVAVPSIVDRPETAWKPSSMRGPPDLLRVVASRLPDRLEEHVRGVVRQRPQGVGTWPCLSCTSSPTPRPPAACRPGIVVGEVPPSMALPAILTRSGNPSRRGRSTGPSFLSPAPAWRSARPCCIVRQEEHVRAGGLHLGQQRGESTSSFPYDSNAATFPPASGGVAEDLGDPLE